MRICLTHPKSVRFLAMNQIMAATSATAVTRPRDVLTLPNGGQLVIERGSLDTSVSLTLFLGAYAVTTPNGLLTSTSKRPKKRR